LLKLKLKHYDEAQEDEGLPQSNKKLVHCSEVKIVIPKSERA
jgi:hypothetical protein